MNNHHNTPQNIAQTTIYMQVTNANKASLLCLPGELLLGLLQYLDYEDLVNLFITCRAMYHIMQETGWKDYCRATYRETPSVAGRWRTLTWRQRAHEAYLINERWSNRIFVGATLNSRWLAKHRPELALSRLRLAVASGHTITTYRFGGVEKGQHTSVTLEGTFSVFPPAMGFDITGLSFLPDGGKDETLLVSNYSGDLVCIRLPIDDNLFSIHDKDRRWREIQAIKTAQYQIPRSSLRKIAGTGSDVLALTNSGSAYLINALSPWVTPAGVSVGTTIWSGHLELGSSTPYAAIGTDKNIAIHPIVQTSLSPSALAVLGGAKNSPVYSIAQYWPGGSPDMVASGWYDGKVRVHDLRSSVKMWDKDSMSGATPVPIKPVLTLIDPWQPFDPVYSIAARAQIDDEVGRNKERSNGMPHHSHFVVAGNALHSSISIWDVRQPAHGWSTFAPGRDWSPVYSLKAEGSRIWGATQCRAFAMDFNPGASVTAYPWTEHNSRANKSTNMTITHISARTRSVVVDLDNLNV